MMAKSIAAGDERMAAEMHEHGMELQNAYGAPASEGPGDAQWQMLLGKVAEADRGNNPRMS